MEKRQLNFNAPLLSVRRYSSPTNSSELVKRKVIEKPVPIRQQSLPLNKSDWEIEVVTKPAAVPFHWEQIPGKPKDEVENLVYTPEQPSNTPRLPPARISDAIRRNSGEIPRLPPGRPSGPSRYNSGERSCEQSIYRPQIEAFSFSDHASLLEKLNESLNCGDSDTESGDDAYSDALDSLSQTESSSFNYSVSGLSGYQSSGVKPSGTFSVDAQTRDFMMNRFLPAAKAVVLETPQYVVKKPSVVNEQPKQQIKKVISVERKIILDQYGSLPMPYYSQYTDNVESEDEEQECSIPAKKSGKVWGILPRFCVKNSLCLFNPLPGMKLKSHTPTSSASEVRRLTRKAHSGPLDKKTCHVPQKKKFYSGLLSRDLPEIEKKLASDSNQFLHSRDSYKLGMSPLRRNRSRSISPYRNESPKSPFREGVGFLGMPKEVENHNAKKIASSRKLFKALQDVSRNQINERVSGPPSNAVEKTLYVDFVNKTNLPISKLSRSKAEAQVDLSGDSLKFLSDRRQIVSNNTVKSSVQETSIPNTLEEGTKMSPISRSTDEVSPSSCIPKPGCGSDGMENAKTNQSPNQESRPLECTEVKTDVKFGLKDENTPESDDQREFDPACFKSPLPPPLPNSPTESWLWRTLPSISLGNPFSHPRHRSQFHSKKQGRKGPNTDTKWETIVKTSYLRHDHVHYSEELIPHVSHRQKQIIEKENYP